MYKGSNAPLNQICPILNSSDWIYLWQNTIVSPETYYIHINVLITCMVTDQIVQSDAIHLIPGKGVKFEVLAYTSSFKLLPLNVVMRIWWAQFSPEGWGRSGLRKSNLGTCPKTGVSRQTWRYKGAISLSLRYDITTSLSVRVSMLQTIRA